jgi:hypothetical protein
MGPGKGSAHGFRGDSSVYPIAMNTAQFGAQWRQATWRRSQDLYVSREGFMTQSRIFGMPLVVVAVLGLAVGVRSAGAQNREARGNVVAVSDSSLTVKAGAADLTFAVSADTKVEAPGAGRRTRTAREAGGSAVRITEFVKTGRPVLVTYREPNGRYQAVSVRPISTAGSGDSPKSESAKVASGKVTSITASAMTVNHDGQDLTFAVDAATTVSARGAGRATKAAGGRVSITDLVGKGDTVSVTYRNVGNAMNASQVRITVKGH